MTTQLYGRHVRCVVGVLTVAFIVTQLGCPSTAPIADDLASGLSSAFTGITATDSPGTDSGDSAGASSVLSALDGSYTAGQVTLVFEKNAGQALIANRAQLYDWAGASGFLSNAGERATQSLEGVQTVTPDAFRHVAQLQQDHELLAKLSRLSYDPTSATISAEVSFAIRSGTAQPDGVGNASHAVHVEWTKLINTNTDDTLMAESGRLVWIDATGAEASRDLGLTQFAAVASQDGLGGIWMFQTVLDQTGSRCSFLSGMSDESVAQWTCDYEWAFYAYEFADDGGGVALHGRTTGWPGERPDGETRIAAAPNWDDVLLGATTFPIGTSTEECFPRSHNEQECTNLAVVELSLAANENVRGTLVAQRTPGDASGFFFSGGVVRARVDPLFVPDREAPHTLREVAAIIRRELVFSRLDLHSRLRDGRELDGHGDPRATISLSGPWISSRMPVTIDPPVVTVRRGQTARAVARVQQPTTDVKFYWPHVRSIDPSSDAWTPDLEFHIPEDWDAAVRGFPLFVWTYDDDGNVGYGLVTVTITD